MCTMYGVDNSDWLILYSNYLGGFLCGNGKQRGEVFLGLQTGMASMTGWYSKHVSIFGIDTC